MEEISAGREYVALEGSGWRTWPGVGTTEIDEDG